MNQAHTPVILAYRSLKSVDFHILLKNLTKSNMREAPKTYSGSFDPGDLENVLTRRAPKLQLSHFAHILLTYKTQSMHVFKKLLSNLKFLSERNVL